MCMTCTKLCKPIIRCNIFPFSYNPLFFLPFYCKINNNAVE